jgi:hypothetical protein
LQPSIFEVKYSDGTQKAYDAMEFVPSTDIKFQFLDCQEPTVQALLECFIPNQLLANIAKHSNAYARAKGRSISPITEVDLVLFLSLIFYMDVVTLPAKKDYWRGEGMWPTHKPFSYMSERRFHQIWMNIHLVKPENNENDEEPNGETEIDDSFRDDDVEPVDERWYAKAAPRIDHVNKTSQQITKWLGDTLSIDEMMKLFKGRSIQTFRMKNKPVKQGFKFWAIADSKTGFIYKFIPASRIGRIDEEGRKVIDSVLALIKAIPHRLTKKHIVAMDNYFTYSKTLKGARDLGVAAFGTAKAKRGWPPKEIKNLSDMRFNTLY